jgi:tetratricopeptide (TPR) repeat protein
MAAGVLALGTLSAQPVAAKPVATAVFAAIEAALAAGNGNQAFHLSDDALNMPDLDGADQARLMLERGLAHNLQGESLDALVDMTGAIDTPGLPAPERARAYLERGLLLDGMDRLNDAIGDYSEAIRLAPHSAPALNNRANAYRRQNQFDEARRDYLASLAAGNPAPEYPYYGLGQIAEQQGEAAQAKDFYARAIAANPGYRLAGERLAALGGVAPAHSPIVLRPPSPQPAPAPAAAKRGPAMSLAAELGPNLRPSLDKPGGQEVQLGAWRQEADAAQGWQRAQAAAEEALAGLSSHIVAVDLPGRGRWYRLRVTTPDRRQLCAALKARGVDCIPVQD